MAGTRSSSSSSSSCFSLVALLWFWTEAAARVLQGEQAHGDVQRVQVVASVFCDVCLEGRVTKNSVFLSDVKAIMDCKNRASQASYYTIQGSTDKTGRFIVELPSNLSDDWQEDCSISVQTPPPHSSCSVPLNSGLSPLRTSKRLDSEKIVYYTAGPFIYQPTEALASCARHGYQLRPVTSSLQILATTNSLSLGPPDPPRP